MVFYKVGGGSVKLPSVFSADHIRTHTLTFHTFYLSCAALCCALGKRLPSRDTLVRSCLGTRLRSRHSSKIHKSSGNAGGGIAPLGDPRRFLSMINKDEIDLAMLDVLTPAVFDRLDGRGIKHFRGYLRSIGWSPNETGTSEYLVDSRMQPIPDIIASQVVAGFGCYSRRMGRNATEEMQALKHDYRTFGRNRDFFDSELVRMSQKSHTRQEGRAQGRKRLSNRTEGLTSDMVRRAVRTIFPDTLDLKVASKREHDRAWAITVGFIMFHWPNVRCSNLACAVSNKKAKKYAALRAAKCRRAKVDFDEEAAVAEFRKNHSLRVGDVTFCKLRPDGNESWFNPIEWVTDPETKGTVPDLAGLLVISAKKNQFGNRPVVQVAATSNYADGMLNRRLVKIAETGEFASLNDLFFSRPALVRAPAIKGKKLVWRKSPTLRRELQTRAIGVVAKDISEAEGLGRDNHSAKAFKISGITAAKAAGKSKKYVQRLVGHKSFSSTAHYVRESYEASGGAASSWGQQDVTELSSTAVRRGAVMFRGVAAAM